MKYAEHISDLVGNTPLVKLNSVVEDAGVRCTVLAKIEYFNPVARSRTASRCA